jgi:hypothetical protein
MWYYASFTLATDYRHEALARALQVLGIACEAGRGPPLGGCIIGVAGLDAEETVWSHIEYAIFVF